ncbi:hypothetical protein G7047_24105 [Diaphorobacter sp. HDW4A]|uniref:hypothetical protein n=1 Tax=Diaphorobacter sp. HDW4A TaxID=2714924 RepID=UPI00140DD912|nr:hypothetical protein [Diaphorobacter sp. HDW4A]QIL82673.1 hypothetical protein G7047_24105 [Diaphorobacter sp. HDW4A]
MFKKVIAVSALLAAGCVQAFTPQAGTWIVNSENNGQPGRGFGLDVQGTTLVLQMYAYDAAGNSTFYLSAGKLGGNHQYSGALNQYRGGRHFGSGDLSGREVGSAGQVSMRFVSGTQGYITFPNESEKEISRYSFAYGTGPESLLGIWLFSGIDVYGVESDFVGLSKISKGTDDGSGMVSTSDYRFACENMTRGSLAGKVLCIKLNASGQWIRGYLFAYSVNDGEGVSGPKADTSSELLIVRRLTNVDSDGTGILAKNEAVESSENDVQVQQLQGAMQQFVQLSQIQE